MLRPKTDVVSEISINNILILSHLAGGGGPCVVVISTYMPTKMGSFFKLMFPFRWII